MKNKPNNRCVAVCLAVMAGILVWGIGLHAGTGSGKVTVTHMPKTITTLDAGWAWAMESANKAKGIKGFYIGYSIRRMMGENSFIGRWSSNRDEEEKTLNEIIYGIKLTGPQNSYGGKSPGDVARMVLKDAKGVKSKHRSEKKVSKDVVILFRFENSSYFNDLKVSNIELSAKLEDGPLFWLGPAKNGESITLLEGLYSRTGKSGSLSTSDIVEIKEDLVMAVAMHDESSRAFPFLKSVLTGSEPDDVREKAAFWLGESQYPRATKLLLQAATNDRSEDVREKAVFGLYLTRSGEADDALIHLARKGKDRAARKKAIFWLGQRAVKRSAEVLNDVVNNDKDIKIRKAAIFALSQLSDDQGVPSLIKIAKTHKSLAVRKKAIFWLSQSDDPRALNTIIQLIEN